MESRKAAAGCYLRAPWSSKSVARSGCFPLDREEARSSLSGYRSRLRSTLKEPQMSEQRAHLDDRPRVLIVEDDEQTRAEFKELLQLWGYTPVVAEGWGAELVADATRLGWASRCHIALIDIRLMGDWAIDTLGLEVL